MQDKKKIMLSTERNVQQWLGTKHQFERRKRGCPWARQWQEFSHCLSQQAC